MEEAARSFVDFLIPLVELIGAAVIGVGVLVAFGAYVLSELRVRPRPYEAIRLLLGRFLALGLEFQLASDILGTAVSPSFAEIGKLGAVAAIRTLLNYFLAQEIERAQRIVERDRNLAAHPADERPVTDGTAGRPPDTIGSRAQR
jgi:uncharacterized membrane protein